MAHHCLHVTLNGNNGSSQLKFVKYLRTFAFMKQKNCHGNFLSLSCGWLGSQTFFFADCAKSPPPSIPLTSSVDERQFVKLMHLHFEWFYAPKSPVYPVKALLLLLRCRCEGFWEVMYWRSADAKLYLVMWPIDVKPICHVQLRMNRWSFLMSHLQSDYLQTFFFFKRQIMWKGTNCLPRDWKRSFDTCLYFSCRRLSRPSPTRRPPHSVKLMEPRMEIKLSGAANNSNRLLNASRRGSLFCSAVAVSFRDAAFNQDEMYFQGWGACEVQIRKKIWDKNHPARVCWLFNSTKNAKAAFWTRKYFAAILSG